jgi:hypothetical protein
MQLAIDGMVIMFYAGPTGEQSQRFLQPWGVYFLGFQFHGNVCVPESFFARLCPLFLPSS